jgi:hypothetical protein
MGRPTCARSSALDDNSARLRGRRCEWVASSPLARRPQPAGVGHGLIASSRRAPSPPAARAVPLPCFPCSFGVAHRLRGGRGWELQAIAKAPAPPRPIIGMAVARSVAGHR